MIKYTVRFLIFCDCIVKKKPSTAKVWFGFRELYTDTFEFSISKIIPLRFANTPPSDYDTILSVLIQAATKVRALGQSHAFLTFDQPLH